MAWRDVVGVWASGKENVTGRGVQLPPLEMAGSTDDGIQSLRGVAVLLVLAFHLQLPWSGGGYLGVDIFFVISGYLMARLYGALSGDVAVRDFYMRRAARLLPAYYVTIAVVVAVSAAIVLPAEFKDVRDQSLWSWALLPNIGSWLGSSYFESHQFRPLLHLWSIGVEVAFYLAFPLVAALSRTRPRVLLALSALSLLLFLGLTPFSEKSAFFLPVTRAWQFMAGFYAARWRADGFAARRGPLLMILSLFVLCAGVLRINSAVGSVVATVVAAGLVAGRGGCAPSGGAARILESLGRYSYAIYLVHLPVIALVAFRPFAGMNLQLAPHELCFTALLIALTSVALHHLVEQPLRQPKRRRTFVAFTLGAAALAIAVTPALATQPFRRLTPRQSLAANALLDRPPERCPKLRRLLRPFERSCPITRAGASVALLVGDSHADLLKRALGRELAEQGISLRLLINHRPVSLKATPPWQGGGRYSWLEPHLPPSTVAEEAVRAGAQIVVVHSNQGHFEPEAIMELASEAEARNVAVAVILPVPQYARSIPEHVFSEASHGRTAISRLAANEYAARNTQALARLTAYAASHPLMRLYRPDELLCRPFCEIADNKGRPLYWDNQHLTQTGVGWLRPMLSRLAQQASDSRAPARGTAP